jgi:DNA-binding LytR/AlgR family response regulator
MKTQVAIIAPTNTSQHIKEFISKLEQFEVSYSSDNSLSAFVDLSSQKYNLLFIDTDSVPLNAFELLDSLTHKPKVIILSKDEKHAAKAFDYEALDYLIYPFSFHRFLKSVHRFATLNPTQTTENVKTQAISAGKLQIKANKTLYTFPEEDIFYIESMGDYIKVHTKEKYHLFKYSLQRLERQINPNDFLRIHRSYIVSTQKIESMNSKFITINNKTLPVGRTYQKQARERLQQHFTIMKS